MGDHPCFRWQAERGPGVAAFASANERKAVEVHRIGPQGHLARPASAPAHRGGDIWGHAEDPLDTSPNDRVLDRVPDPDSKLRLGPTVNVPIDQRPTIGLSGGCRHVEGREVRVEDRPFTSLEHQ